MAKGGLAHVQPRCLSREGAALYVGISVRFFDDLVDDGRMPRPKVLGARKLWDRFELDAAIEGLPVDGAKDSGSWEDV